MSMHKIFIGAESPIGNGTIPAAFYLLLLWIEWSLLEESINAIGLGDGSTWSFTGSQKKSRIWRAGGIAITVVTDLIYHRFLRL